MIVAGLWVDAKIKCVATFSFNNHANLLISKQSRENLTYIPLIYPFLFFTIIHLSQRCLCYQPLDPIILLKMKEIDTYREICQIGEGAFGRVYKALDKNNKTVAVKYIKFQNQEEGIPSSALREISLLKTLKNHPNIVPLLEVFYKPKEQTLKIVFDYYEQDLKKFITSKDYKIDQERIKVIIKKIINGVAYIHSKRILHRDLKPQNILVDSAENVKIADFGLARLIMVPQKTLTHEIETLWYRAPQVLLGQKQYTAAVDVWAIGCIFIEMFTKKPFFMGNGYEIQQIFQIFSVLGTPSPKQWPGIDKLPDAKASFPRWKRQSLKEILPQISYEGIEIIQRMLELNPQSRISAQDALNHEYFRNVEI